jgi:hypothetical protein
MKCALFVQATVAVNTKLTSKVAFLFGNFQVFKKNLVKNQARSWLSISGGALQKECNRGVGMILTFVLAASFPFQLRKIGIERNVLLHCKSIILVHNIVSL